MGSWSGWGGMTGNDWTVQFGCWAKSEWKNLTGAAYSAANPESHKYERVPWEVGHVKTKVPGSGQQGEAEGGRRGSKLWKFNLGERSTRSQARGQSRKMSCPSPAQPRWCFLLLPLTLTCATLGASVTVYCPTPVWLQPWSKSQRRAGKFTCTVQRSKEVSRSYSVVIAATGVRSCCFFFNKMMFHMFGRNCISCFSVEIFWRIKTPPSTQ